MNWSEGARSPLSTNTEGGGNMFERGAQVGSDLITICSELRKRQMRKSATKRHVKENDSGPMPMIFGDRSSE